MCGPSSQQNQLAAEQASFYGTLQQGYSQMFSGQTNILSSLQKSFAPILEAGINQYGFSPAEDSALRSQATSGTASQYAAAARASNENVAAVGGGNQFLPSGTQAEIAGQNANTAAGLESSEQLGITQAGYAQGRQNYLAAAGGLQGAASTYNPTGLAGAANTSGQDAFSSASINYQENQQALQQIGGLVGGGAMGLMTGGMGGGAAGLLGSL
jgi:hypothetical protein